MNFIRSNATCGAEYGNRTLTFNLSKLPYFFDIFITAQQIKLLTHELGHEEGMHTEASYHKLITKLAGELVMVALHELGWFEVH